MKKSIKIKTFIAITVLAIFGVTSCSESNDPYVTPVPTAPSADNTIVGKAVASSNLTILVAALQKTELVETLKGAGPYTVFAPTNAAFGEANISVASINSYTPAQVASLKQILLNHVVSGATTAAQLTDNSYLKTLGLGAASTTNKLSMFVKKTVTAASTTVKLNNNSTVVSADIAASNGVIHIVDKVITAPTIIDLAATNSNFSTLAGSLTSASLVTTLQGTGPFTVFAPDNTAFANLITEIGSAPTVPQYVNVLKYHVVAGNYLASDLPAVISAGPTVTLNPQTITISLTGGPNITGTKLPVRSASKITATDIQANNGVIHVLDKVLLPATF